MTVHGKNSHSNAIALAHSKLEQYNSHAGLSWIFHFVDIIYVGAIYKIGQLFEQCGTDHKVFFLAAAYMGIMFTTRYQFDQYASTFATHKTTNSKEFLRIILMILYCMAIYSMTLNITFDRTTGESEGVGHFGECVRNETYDNVFAVAFLISRVTIIVLFFNRFRNEKYRNSADFKILFRRKAIPTFVSSCLMTMIFADVSPVVVFSTVAFVEFFSEFIGEAMVYLKHSEQVPLMPEPEHLQERLGLFFMLVLGETMVGTLFLKYETGAIKRTYGTCLAAFVLVTCIGMQFFERAQADVDSPSNEYGDVYDENDDVTRLSTYVEDEEDEGESAAVSALHASTVAAAVSDVVPVKKNAIFQLESDDNSVVSSGSSRTASSLANSKWNHHPLLHKNKLFYASYVALHALVSFFMLIATTAIIEIYYEIEQYHPYDDGHGEASSDGHYFHLKAQIISGLVGVWCCMLVMELLQPEFYNSLMADWKTSKIVDQQYSKVMFALKIVVIFCHILLLAQSDNPEKGNYFIFYNALVASVPSVCDICKIVYEYVFDVTAIRTENAKKVLEQKRHSAALERMSGAVEAAHTLQQTPSVGH